MEVAAAEALAVAVERLRDSSSSSLSSILTSIFDGFRLSISAKKTTGVMFASLSHSHSH